MTIVQTVDGIVLFDTEEEIMDEENKVEFLKLLIEISEDESFMWFLFYLPLEKQLKIIKPHYEQWFNDQQVALEKVRGD